jgi:hypothetical protein
MQNAKRTILEFIEENFKAQKRARLDKLIGMGGAPQVVVDTIKKELDGDGGASKVGKIKEFGHLRIVDFKTQKYRRGTGVTFTTDGGPVVKFIPGPHSWFLTTDK